MCSVERKEHVCVKQFLTIIATLQGAIEHTMHTGHTMADKWTH